jgi:saccharopine dehydrogenase (NAD+, L-lysine-forming)
MAKTILLLGAAGNTGRLMTRYLLEQSDAQIILAGRNESRVRDLSAELDQKFPGRTSARKVDASSAPSLQSALEGVDLLVAASSTSQYVEQTARACLGAGVDYFDIQFSSSKLITLDALKDEIESRGLCFVTDGGFHPGLPAVLVRHAATQFDELHTANVGSVIKIDWAGLDISEATVIEMVQEFGNFSTLFFQHGRWKKGRMDIVVDTLKMDFGPPFGRQLCMPMWLEEMHSLPEQFPALTDTGFFVGGFNWFSDWFIMPLMMVIVKLAPQKGLIPGGNLLLWSLKRFSSPPYGTRLKLEASGIKNATAKKFEMIVAHDDGYVLTAIPAVACVLQMLDGSARKPGLHFQAQIVETVKFFDDMQRMGVEIKFL